MWTRESTDMAMSFQGLYWGPQSPEVGLGALAARLGYLGLPQSEVPESEVSDCDLGPCLTGRGTPPTAPLPHRHPAPTGVSPPCTFLFSKVESSIQFCLKKAFRN